MHSRSRRSFPVRYKQIHQPSYRSIDCPGWRFILSSPNRATHPTELRTTPRMGSSSSRPAVVRDAIPHPGLIGLAQDISKEADLPWWSRRPSAPPSLRRGRFAGSRRNSETRHTPLRHRWPRTRDRAPGISSPGSDRSPGRCAEARSSRARPSTREPSGSPSP
jgi:hypothetical protein